MKLAKLILVNWGSLRSDEYPMGNMTLLTGPTGSGKSTLLDALQTVMTATYHTIYSYNPGQDETTQTSRGSKSKRTLWSYIVGAEDNLFARPDGAHGYVAAVFKPDAQEEGKPFTALIGVAARVDGSGHRRQAVQERLALLLIDDAELCLADLAYFDDYDNMIAVDVESIETQLKARYPQVLNLRDTKREYLCQLYGRFRGLRSVSFAEAESAAKAWSSAIAHKPIGGVDELVKTQILEYDSQNLPQRISQISDLMRQVHHLRLEGDRLNENIVRLERLEQLLGQANSAYEQAVQCKLAHSQRSLQDDLQLIRKAEQQVAELAAKIQLSQQAIDAISHEKQACLASQIQLEARLLGIDAANQKQQLEARLQQARLDMQATQQTLYAALQQGEAMQSIAHSIMAMQFPLTQRPLTQAAEQVAQRMQAVGAVDLTPLLLGLDTVRSEADLDGSVITALLQELPALQGHFDQLHQVLTGTQNSFLATLHAQRGQLQNRLDEARTQLKKLAERKANLAEGGADYPREIAQALKLFHSELPAARAQVLCDLIEPNDLTWQPAIEGYLAGARFNLVVDEQLEAQAIEFVRVKRLRAKVIQGTLCKRNAKPERLPKESIVHELRTEHPTAYAYLVEQYGNVVKVDDVEQLRLTPRGVMKDGKAAGSRTLFTGDTDLSLVFGLEAQRQSRQKANTEHAKAEQDVQTLLDDGKQLDVLLALLDGIQLPNFSDTSRLEKAVQDSRAALANLGRLDLSEVNVLEAEKALLLQDINALDKRLAQANQEIGKYTQGQQLAKQSLSDLQNGLPAREQQIASDTQPLQWLCAVNEALSMNGLLEDVERWATSKDWTPYQLNEQHTQKLLQANSAYGKLHEALGEYNQHARSYEQLPLTEEGESRDSDFAGHYKQLVDLGQRLRQQLKEQREIGFVRNLNKLRTAESSFKDVFTKQFCYEIRNAVDQGVKTLKLLNAELQRLKFGTDRFQLDWSAWVPEFKEYYDFFCAAYDLSESQDSGDLFATEALSPEQCKIRDRLAGLLLADDQEQALKELQRVADYRNYRRYEIWKDSDSGSRVALSEWGTGSGGQLETPAYIVRAAVVTNRLKHFDKGTNLKLLVNDESFAKMDERRAHDVIRFLRDSLDMQLICAMPTKHAGAIKTEFTKEWSFSRNEAQGNGEVDFMSEADQRDLHPDKLRELWEHRRKQIREQARIEFEGLAGF